MSHHTEEALKAWADETNAISTRLRQENPALPLVTAHVMANDMVSAASWAKRARTGEVPREQAVWLTGSYARLDQAIDLMSKDWVIANLPELWRGSDPNDLDPRYLALWLHAKRRNNGYVRDGRPLPRNRMLTVYRGQMLGDPMGIAWTREPDIANKFARGAGARVAHLDGVILMGQVARTDVLGYLTLRGEEEVVVDPRNVKETQ